MLFQVKLWGQDSFAEKPQPSFILQTYKIQESYFSEYTYPHISTNAKEKEAKKCCCIEMYDLSFGDKNRAMLTRDQGVATCLLKN